MNTTYISIAASSRTSFSNNNFASFPHPTLLHSVHWSLSSLLLIRSRVWFLMSCSIYLWCIQLREKWSNIPLPSYLSPWHLSLHSSICRPSPTLSTTKVFNHPTDTSTRSPDIRYHTSSFIAQKARFQET